MFVYIFLSDFEFGLKKFDVFIDGEEDVFVLDFEFFVDLSKTGIDMLKIADHRFFSES